MKGFPRQIMKNSRKTQLYRNTMNQYNTKSKHLRQDLGNGPCLRIKCENEKMSYSSYFYLISYRMLKFKLLLSVLYNVNLSLLFSNYMFCDSKILQETSASDYSTTFVIVGAVSVLLAVGYYAFYKLFSFLHDQSCGDSSDSSGDSSDSSGDSSDSSGDIPPILIFRDIPRKDIIFDEKTQNAIDKFHDTYDQFI